MPEPAKFPGLEFSTGPARPGVSTGWGSTALGGGTSPAQSGHGNHEGATEPCTGDQATTVGGVPQTIVRLGGRRPGHAAARAAVTRRKRRNFTRRARRSTALASPSSTPQPASAPPLRLNQPADLVAIVPFLLGFEPAESLVTLFLRDRQIFLTARMDLLDVADPTVLRASITRLVLAHRPEQLIAVVYSRRGAAIRGLANDVVDTLAEHALVEALLVDDQRWWSLICTDACCPAEGVPYDRSTHRVTAEAVYAGRTALPDRAALAARAAGPAESDLAHLTALTEQQATELAPGRRAQQDEVARLVTEYLADPRPLEQATLCRLAALVGDVHVRDVAWAAMDRSRAEDHLDLWHQVVGCAVSPLESAPLCLLGMAAWISGDGALLNVCIDRVSDCDPTYTMTDILVDITERALPPSLWEDLQVGLGDSVRRLAG